MTTQDPFRKNLAAQEVEQLFYKVLAELLRPASEQYVREDVLLQKLSVSKRTLATWRAEGKMPHHRLEGIILYNLAEVNEMIRAHRVQPPSERVRLFGGAKSGAATGAQTKRRAA